MKLVTALLLSLALAGCLTTQGHGPGNLASTSSPQPPTIPPPSFDAAHFCDVDSLATQKDGTSTSTDLEKMKAFDASIDAEYRNMINACRAYAQCMQSNAYDQGKCSALQRRWEEAEAAFSELSVRLKNASGRTSQRQSEGGPRLGKPAPGFPAYGFVGGGSDRGGG